VRFMMPADDFDDGMDDEVIAHGLLANVSMKSEDVNKPGGMDHQKDFGFKQEYLQGVAMSMQEGRGHHAFTHTYIGEEDTLGGFWIDLSADKKPAKPAEPKRSEMRMPDVSTAFLATAAAGALALAGIAIYKEVRFWVFRRRVRGSPREDRSQIPLGGELPVTSKPGLAGQMETITNEMGRLKIELAVVDDNLLKNPTTEKLKSEREALAEAIVQYEQQLRVLRENARREDFERGLALLKPLLAKVPAATWERLRQLFPGASQRGAFPLTVDSVAGSLGAQSVFQKRHCALQKISDPQCVVQEPSLLHTL